jgi:hypothetical protein
MNTKRFIGIVLLAEGCAFLLVRLILPFIYTYALHSEIELFAVYWAFIYLDMPAMLLVSVIIALLVHWKSRANIKRSSFLICVVLAIVVALLFIVVTFPASIGSGLKGVNN